MERVCKGYVSGYETNVVVISYACEVLYGHAAPTFSQHPWLEVLIGAMNRKGHSRTVHLGLVQTTCPEVLVNFHTHRRVYTYACV